MTKLRVNHLRALIKIENYEIITGIYLNELLRLYSWIRDDKLVTKEFWDNYIKPNHDNCAETLNNNRFNETIKEHLQLETNMSIQSQTEIITQVIDKKEIASSLVSTLNRSPEFSDAMFLYIVFRIGFEEALINNVSSWLIYIYSFWSNLFSNLF